MSDEEGDAYHDLGGVVEGSHQQGALTRRYVHLQTQLLYPLHCVGELFISMSAFTQGQCRSHSIVMSHTLTDGLVSPLDFLYVIVCNAVGRGEFDKPARLSISMGVCDGGICSIWDIRPHLRLLICGALKACH